MFGRTQICAAACIVGASAHRLSFHFSSLRNYRASIMTEDIQAIPTPIRRGDILLLDIEKAAFEGKAIARPDGFVVFVQGAVPGDRVEAEVYRKKQQFAEARLLRVVEASEQRVEPRCNHFGVCGGCSWQHLAYEQQCLWKRDHVRDAFERIGGFENPSVRDTLSASEPFWYRNKMEYSFGEMRWLLPDELGVVERDAELFALGLHVPKRYDRILDIRECFPESNAILSATREFFLSRGIPAYSTRTHTGELRHLVIREGKNTGERMVFLVTSNEHTELYGAYAEMLKEERFSVSTLVQGVTSRKSSVAIAEKEITWFGNGSISERLGRNTFRISPTSFFQTNTLQAERLYATAEAAAGLRSADTVWDLYCGTGTISLFIARDVRHVVGVELNEAAIADARRNAADNGIGNVEFHCADIVDFLAPERSAGVPRPDVIIVDPPRAGMHTKVVEAIGASGVERLVYVSCNPSTSARDCAMLAECGYEVTEITPVDMFPHTWHIECVIALRRKGEPA
jgi:23S rRNA (uracil1939-C5)-methyltransferase